MANPVKELYVTYFGSPDLNEPLSRTQLEELGRRVMAARPADLRAIPHMIVADRVVRLRVDRIVLGPGDTVSAMAKGGPRGVARQAELDEALRLFHRATSPEELAKGPSTMVLLPYYVELRVASTELESEKEKARG